MIVTATAGRDYRFLLQAIFSRFFAAYPVRFFASGRAFLQDRHMPDLDGHQTLVELKQNPDYKRIPVVMLSGAALAAEIDNCYEAGANSFLLKTTTFESLKETIGLICQYWLEINQRTN